MKLVTYSLLVSVILFTNNLFAQTPVGHFFDADRYPIEGYFDELNYSSNQSLNITHNSESFEEGYYYDREGNLYEGLIKFQNKKFWFKKSGFVNKEKLKPEDINTLVIGVDSFFTITNFNVEQKVGASFRSSPEFVQFICEFADLTFAKHYNFSSGLAQQYTMASALIETYQVKKKGADRWVSFPRRKREFKKVALEYFGHIPYLKTKIEEGELDFDDMMTLIKMSEYHNKYENNEKIYFDKYWQERIKEKLSRYHAKIAVKEDSIWTINYYEGTNLLYSTQYSSFYPSRKNGESKVYDNIGNLRQVTNYENNKPKSVSTFFLNGQLHHEYLIMHHGFTNMSMVKYTKVYNESGDLLLDESGNGVEIINDSISDRTITRNYKGFQLESSTFEINGELIYQPVNLSYDVSLKSLQRGLTSFMEDKKLALAVKDDAQGTVLISVTVDEKGYSSSCTILNNLHPTIDQHIRHFVKERIEETASFRFKFRKNKLGKEKIKYEFVIPLSFNINRFYRKPANYYYDPNFHMMHQQMMQQQMINNIPAPPSRF